MLNTELPQLCWGLAKHSSYSALYLITVTYCKTLLPFLQEGHPDQDFPAQK